MGTFLQSGHGIAGSAEALLAPGAAGGRSDAAQSPVGPSFVARLGRPGLLRGLAFGLPVSSALWFLILAPLL